jgi:hypothetical protein
MARINPFSRSRKVFSLLCGVCAGVGTLFGTWTSLPGDDPAAIREATSAINRFAENYRRRPDGQVSPFADLVTPTWKDIKALSDRLDYSNGRIARAKALAILERNPELHGYEWDERFETAAKRYDVCSLAKRGWTSVTLALLAFPVAAFVVWVLLMLLSWVWYFSLDRVRELSRSVRGRQHSADDV